MKETKAWKCEYCDETFILKEKTEIHESTCRNNESLRSCRRCKNFVKKFGQDSYGYSTNESYCKLKHKTQRQYEDEMDVYYDCIDFEFVKDMKICKDGK